MTICINFLKIFNHKLTQFEYSFGRSLYFNHGISVIIVVPLVFITQLMAMSSKQFAYCKIVKIRENVISEML